MSVLETSVLVLNKFYTAIHLISARKAFCLLVKEVAEVVSVDEGHFSNYVFPAWRDESQRRVDHGEHSDSEWVLGVSQSIEVPKVIRLLTYDKLPAQGARFNRRNVLARDGNVCCYCGQRFPSQDLSIDHVMPRSQGGRTAWKNIVTACTDCNKRKGGRTPLEASMKLLRRPVAPRITPLVNIKPENPKYGTWKHFLHG